MGTSKNSFFEADKFLKTQSAAADEAFKNEVQR